MFWCYHKLERRVDRLEQAVLSLEASVITLQLEIIKLEQLIKHKHFPATTGIKVKQL